MTIKIIAELCQNHNGDKEILTNMIDEASKAKRIHHQWKPDVLFIENEKNLKDIDELGFDIIYRERIGETHSILFHKDRNEGFADLRRPDGKAISVH